MKKVLTVARKEFSAFFASPTAFIFLGAFLLVSLFTFFWVESFFSRNIADVRPLFEWMPLLMVFLVSAITMRLWSEERRMGTIEFVMTMPVSLARVTLGKFVACMALVGLALFLTLGVPITVAILGDLDWGPVWGAYLATLLLCSAYAAIGLFVSARSDNQIVALIAGVGVCLLFYLPGNASLTGLVGNQWSELLALCSTSGRFESLARGVVDLRDCYFYLSVTVVFLALTVFSLERLRWATGVVRNKYSVWTLGLVLLVANAVALNLTLAPTRGVRVDLTATKKYSVSATTRSLLARLQEPLLLRGYFSGQTHPLLAPLVPDIKDMLREYEVAGGGKVQSEFVDPLSDNSLEEEANQKFGIRAMPFQVAEKYKQSVVNSYFSILIQYGDQFEVLNLQDIIESKVTGSNTLDVKLRNLEYDVTRTIKKVLYGFQTTESLMASFSEPVTFVGYISASLPETLREGQSELMAALADLKNEGGENFEVTIQDPEAGGAELAERLARDYGFQPMRASLFDATAFYFNLTLQQGDQVVPLALPAEFTKEEFKRTLEAGLKRFSTGVLKVIGIHRPESPAPNPMAPTMPQGKQYRVVPESLKGDYNVVQVDMESGIVPEEVDLLMVLAPENLSLKELFALDQFLMKGGSVVLASNGTSVTRTPEGIKAEPTVSGLEEWLKHLGLTMKPALVLDKSNEPYPIPVQRNLGGFMVQQIELVPYPPFPEIRSSGMNESVGLTGGLNQVTLNWASPIEVSESLPEGSRWSWLLRTSDASVTSGLSADPDFNSFPEFGFDMSQASGPHVVAGVLDGSFTSYFAEKDNPLLADESAEETGAEAEDSAQAPIPGVINRSSGAPKLLLFSSNEFIADEVFQLSAAAGSSRYLNTLQLLQNAADWALEDKSLLALRGRASFSRTLPQMPDAVKSRWEYLNYAFALLGLLLVAGIHKLGRRGRVVKYELAYCQ